MNNPSTKNQFKPHAPDVVAADDTELLALVADIRTAHEKSNKASDAWTVRCAEIEAMPDYPAEPTDWPTTEEEHEVSRFRRDEQFAFRKRHGDCEMADASNNTGSECGRAANAVFAIPAQTDRGAYEKVKIARLATGSMAESGLGEGDANLSCYQDLDAPWIDNALVDLERLAGSVFHNAVETQTPDPLVGLWDEWESL